MVVVGVASVSVAVYFLVTLAQVWSTGRDDSFATGARTVDAIVVLGAAQYDGRPSPQLQARLDHALLLWKEDLQKSSIPEKAVMLFLQLWIL